MAHPPLRRAATLAMVLAAASAAHATIHVSTQGADSGDGRNPSAPVRSLAYALSQAAVGEEVRVAKGTYTGKVPVLQAVEILGGWNESFTTQDTANPQDTVLTPATAGASRVVEVDGSLFAGSTLRIRQLTIRDGNAGSETVGPGQGGGIYAPMVPELVLDGVVIENNVARSAYDSVGDRADGEGGGVYTGAGTLTVLDSTIRSNTGTTGDTGGSGADVGDGLGGGIHIIYRRSAPGQNIEIRKTTFQQNRAQNTPQNFSGNQFGSGFGGGIYIGDGGGAEDPNAGLSILIDNSNFISNNGIGVSADDDEAAGGGIAVNLPNMSSAAAGRSTLTVSDTAFQTNIAGNGGSNSVLSGQFNEGGGIWTRTPKAFPIVIGGCAFDLNFGEDRVGVSGGFGGGASLNGGTVTITNSTFTNNIGGSNGCNGAGGAIAANGTELLVERCNFMNNQGIDVPDTFCFGLFSADGGAIYYTNPTNPTQAGDLTVVNCFFTDNYGSTSTSVPSSSQFGGAIFADAKSGTVRVLNNSFYNSQDKTPAAVAIASGAIEMVNNLIFGFLNGLFLEDGTSITNIAFWIMDLFESGLAAFTGGPGAPATTDPSLVDADPKFTDPANGDLHLQGGSPAIDAGTTLTGVDTDIDGDPRPVGNAPDIGADEFVAPPDPDLDFGDAPDTYGTTLAANGARQQNPLFIPYPFFDGSPDQEADGQPNANALGDDNDGLDDEDGLAQVTSCILPGVTDLVIPRQADGEASLLVTYHDNAHITGWIDFNGNGQFDDGPESVIDQALPTVQSTFTIPVTFPVAASTAQAPGTTTFSRFRINNAGRTGPLGLGGFGEVEDHKVHFARTVDAAVSVKVLNRSGAGGENIDITYELTNLGPQALDAFVAANVRAIDEKGRLIEDGAVISDRYLTLTSVTPGGAGATTVLGTGFQTLGLATGQVATVAVRYQVKPNNRAALIILNPTACTLDHDTNFANDEATNFFIVFRRTPPGLEAIERIITKLNSTTDPDELATFDVNGDKVVDASDLIRIRQSQKPSDQ
ncbi:MAG: GEVED domain-containing protein [Candidatus Sumerlaeia bacterium]|nr:GEVED domain-containing protein [Candidatus Sumerlaeia bacterium]